MTTLERVRRRQAGDYDVPVLAEPVGGPIPTDGRATQAARALLVAAFERVVDKHGHLHLGHGPHGGEFAKALKASGGPPGPSARPDSGTRFTAALTGSEALLSAPVQVGEARLDNGKWRAPLTGFTGDKETVREVQGALDLYRGADEYRRINSALRQGRPNQYADSIDLAMAASPLPKDVVAWRGVATGVSVFGPEPWPDDLSGAEWVDARFVSVTTERSIAEEDFAGRVLLRVLVSSGTGAVKLSEGTSNLAESELLLQRGLRFRVVADSGDTEDDPYLRAMTPRVLDVEVVPGESARSYQSRGVVVPAEPPKREVRSADALDRLVMDDYPVDVVSRLTVRGLVAGKDTHPGGEQLHLYWTTDPEGLAKWVDHPHPWTALYHHLLMHMDGNELLAKSTASKWFHEVKGYWPGDQKGKNPVGPG